MQGLDLFSGAGGMSIGATMCGIHVKYAVEIEFNAAQTFRLNHPGTKLFATSIKNINPTKDFKFDKNIPIVLFGGPPCQGFSSSNQKNRHSANPGNWLFQEYLRIAKAVKPDWIVFENVKGFVETENGYFFRQVVSGLQALKYQTAHFILNSADFGVPQKRARLFVIGSKQGLLIAPPRPSTANRISVADAIADLPVLENGNSIDTLEYSCLAESVYAKRLRGKLRSCSNHLVTNNSRSIVERYRRVPPGGNWEDIPADLLKNYIDPTRCHSGIYHRLKADEPSVVIGNFRKNMLIHPWANRGLSVREAARLQSFPDSFKFYGSIGFQQQQVGNAVPPLLAKAVFDKIKKTQI